MFKGLGKAGAKAARMGAGQAIQSDLAQEKTMQFLSLMVGDALDKLGDKAAGQQGGILPLLALGGLVPSVVKQLGGGSHTYQSGTEPYQEGGILPHLALGGLIPVLVEQLDGGSKRERRTAITGSSVMTPTLKRLLRRQGESNVGVLPEMISGP